MSGISMVFGYTVVLVFIGLAMIGFCSSALPRHRTRLLNKQGIGWGVVSLVLAVNVLGRGAWAHHAGIDVMADGALRGCSILQTLTVYVVCCYFFLGVYFYGGED